jgi:hypothetical protein
MEKNCFKDATGKADATGDALDDDAHAGSSDVELTRAEDMKYTKTSYFI